MQGKLYFSTTQVSDGHTRRHIQFRRFRGWLSISPHWSHSSMFIISLPLAFRFPMRVLYISLMLCLLQERRAMARWQHPETGSLWSRQHAWISVMATPDKPLPLLNVSRLQRFPYFFQACFPALSMNAHHRVPLAPLLVTWFISRLIQSLTASVFLSTQWTSSLFF